MSKRPELEQRKYGLALTDGVRARPYGYVREGKLVMRSEGEDIEFTPEDLERLAGEIRKAPSVRVFRLTSAA